MSYNITLSEDGQYIISRMTGPVTAELARESSMELHRMCREHNIKRVLTDVRDVPNTLNISQNYEYAYKDMEELGLQRDVRVAILASPDDRSHDFVETVSRNAGYNVRVFHAENAALAWLNKESTS